MQTLYRLNRLKRDLGVVKSETPNVKLNGTTMLNLNHKNLDVWKISSKLVTAIYSITASFPKEELFGLTNQLRRSAVSILSNIAEGSARSSAAERKRFFEISRSSLVEVDAQVEIAKNLHYLDEKAVTELSEVINHDFALLSKLISKTDKSKTTVQ